MNKIIRIYLATLIFASIALSPLSAKAEIHKWDSQSDFLKNAQLQSTTSSTTASKSDEICEGIFKSDSTNIFREVICSFTRLIAISVANLSSEMTCEIQAVGNSTNYLKTTFELKNNGLCSVKSEAGYTGYNALGTEIPPDGLFSGSSLTENINPTSKNLPTVSGFNVTRNLMTILAVIAMFIFAFANILHLDINTYTIKKAIPSIVTAVVGGWLSIYIVFFLSKGVDFLYTLDVFSPYQAFHPMSNIFGGNLGSGTTNSVDESMTLIFKIGSTLMGGSDSYSFFSGFLGSISLIIPALAVFAFEYTLALRPFAVQVLTIVAPIAFACIILPQTQAIFRKWWTFLLIALFYTPAVNFVFYILNSFGTSATDPVTFSALWLLKIVVIVALIRMPFTIQSDFNKLANVLSKTSLGAALGLDKIVRENKPKEKPQPLNLASDRNLSSSKAKDLIAPSSSERLNLKAIPRNNNALQSQEFRTNAGRKTPNLSQLSSSILKDNSNRSTDLLIRSTKDLSPDIFKAVLESSDTKLWQNSDVINQLKSQNGQVLNDEGVALRADSARRLVRLAQIVEADKIANPEALKLLAEKGLLENVPVNVIKKAIDDGILTKESLEPSFKEKTDKILQGAISGSGQGGFISATNAKKLIERDQKDYNTGFKDLTRLFSNVVRDSVVIPPPPPPVIKNIVEQMKDTDNEVFEKNGTYFLSRLNDVQKASQKEISQTLINGGVKPQTAMAIAQNPKIDFNDAKKYLSQEGKTQDNLSLLREGFINRDLSQELSTNISNLVKDQKIILGKGIAQKISQATLDENGLQTIKNSMSKAVDEIKSGAEPEKLEAISEQIDQYYPGSSIQSSFASKQRNPQEIIGKAKSIIETIEDLMNGNISPKDMAKSKEAIDKTIENSVTEKVRKAASGEIAADSEFDSKLSEISSIDKANGNK